MTRLNSKQISIFFFNLVRDMYIEKAARKNRDLHNFYVLKPKQDERGKK